MFLNLPGDVWVMLITLGVFLLVPLIVIYIAYRMIR
jgi:hypothetical protein